MRMNFNLKKGASVLMLSAAVCAASAQIAYHGPKQVMMEDLKKVDMKVTNVSNMRMQPVKKVLHTAGMQKDYAKAQAAGELRYALPAGVYNVSPEGLWGPDVPSNGYFMPLLANVTFENRSTSEYTSFNWIYNDGVEEQTSTEKNLDYMLLLPFENGFVETVTLESAGTQYYHGENMYSGLNTIITPFNTTAKAAIYGDKDNNFTYGHSEKSQISMVGAMFKKPAAPFAIGQIFFPIYLLDETAKLNGQICIVEMTDDGKMTDNLLLPLTPVSSNEYHNVDLILEKPLPISTAFAVMFYPEEFSKQPKWALFSQDWQAFSKEQLADEQCFIFSQNVNPGVENWTPESIFIAPENPALFLSIVSPVVYPLLPADDGSGLVPVPDNKMLVSLDGTGEAGYPLYTMSLAVKLESVKSDDESMITVSDFKLENPDDLIYSCVVNVKKSDKERRGSITFTTAYGTPWTIYFDQFDPASIGSVEQEGSVVAAFNGNAFEVSYPEGVNAVQVVNAAGQTVAEYSLNGTSATIPAAALANGMYVLKFNDGTSVKVMR